MDDAFLAKAAVNFMIGVAGAVFGAGTVYGTTTTRLKALESRMLSLEDQHEKESAAVHQEIGALRSELRADLKDLGADIKSYVRDLAAKR